ncbi:MAG: fibro-slime domain-containing protein [Myxococcales bacterium]|nr:fibro-slime domain-containing protein [Myxococcales bacterium]MCB9708495.1 fibro-slime domain-containing protein [Myxococcales bacterium]
MRLHWVGLCVAVINLCCIGCGKNDAGLRLGDAGTDAADVFGHDAAEEDCSTTLAVTFRDFNDTHPDFENWDLVIDPAAAQPGVVEDELGDDGNPVRADDGPAVTTGAAEFAQWYETVEGVNMAFESTLALVEEPSGAYAYDSAAFFPLDDQGFGNDERAHNYHFTTEVHASFFYHGNEVFTFRGDDDLWVFVNKKLALDLGGVHVSVQGTIDFKEMEVALGLTPGNSYSIDVFHAERHTTDSHFRIETSIRCFGAPFVF